MVLPPALATYLVGLGVPATLAAGQALYGLIQKARGKEGGTSPFGDPARLEQMQAESDESLAFKKRLQPRVQNLLEQRLGELEQPYQSPLQRLAGSPAGAFSQQAIPDFLQGLSGDPEYTTPNWLAPLLETMQQQPQQTQQPPAQTQEDLVQARDAKIQEQETERLQQGLAPIQEGPPGYGLPIHPDFANLSEEKKKQYSTANWRRKETPQVSADRLREMQHQEALNKKYQEDVQALAPGDLRGRAHDLLREKFQRASQLDKNKRR